jgi:hypothetical protein
MDDVHAAYGTNILKQCVDRRSMKGLFGAGEVLGADLVAVVEEEREVDGDIDVDAEDVGLDGGAEADGGVKVDEALDQRAALVICPDGDVELEQVQHVGAHA